jgi:hypothetical protein
LESSLQVHLRTNKCILRDPADENEYINRLGHFSFVACFRVLAPLRRVTSLDLASKEHDYDKEKYREMLLEAAESILGYFGFDMTVYLERKKNRKWWHELRQERRKDVETERNVHDG